MTILNQTEWYDLSRSATWTPKYVKEDELFPDEMTGGHGISLDDWAAFDEPYKVIYSDYVNTQREKDSGAYSVKAALERANFVDEADQGWVSSLKAHYGAIALAEYAAALAESRMARFAPAPGNRNMAVFGMLDEVRHAQMQLFFPHEHTTRSRQWDWAHKAYHTNEWGAIAARHMFDDMMTTGDAIRVAIMLTFAFETGFTNLQFLALAADAAEGGDYTFASLISSIQTDEARHAQQGGAALKILLEHGKKEDAQQMVDRAFWRNWKLFSILTGPMMDYYTPLQHRNQSFKEFMQEWIVSQFERQMVDLGLDVPWYWDEFLRALDETHHGMHMGVWYWRPTVWWNPSAGVTPDDRDWLEEKYPGWNSTWGKCWDVVIDNLVNGRPELTGPATLPMICSMSNLPIVGTPGDGWNVVDYPLEYEGKLYHFGSEPDRWIFQQEPERYKGHLTFIDRFLSGVIQPPDLVGGLQYMGLGPGEMGDDAHNYAWMESYQKKEAAE